MFNKLIPPIYLFQVVNRRTGIPMKCQATSLAQVSLMQSAILERKFAMPVDTVLVAVRARNWGRFQVGQSQTPLGYDGY